MNFNCRILPENLRRVATPVLIVFLASSFLSLIAVLTTGTLNRDGMLYVDTARIFMQEGFSAAQGVFSWPFLPAIMAAVSSATGIDPETAGHLINILFMGGTGALFAACALRLFPESVWPICLAFLAIPGLNDYRNEILREYGCWFFLMLAIWLALRWAENPRWITALSVQISLVIAALFRPEALVFLPALILWQFQEAPAEQRIRRLLMIGSLSLALAILFIILKATGHLPARLSTELGRLSIVRFNEKAAAISTHFIPYAQDQARTVLLFGSLAIIPIKFVKMTGLFLVPLFYFLATSKNLLSILSRMRIFIWILILHLLVLAVFVTDMQFLAGRYVAPLMLLTAPLTGLGIAALMSRFPRWKWLIVGIALVIMLTNTVNLRTDKQHFIEAGQWLSGHTRESSRIFIESPRTAYYAGWRFSDKQSPQEHLRERLESDIAGNKYDLAVLEFSARHSDITAWLENKGLEEIRRFTDSAGKAAVVIAKPSAQPLTDPDGNSRSARIDKNTD